MTDTELKEIAAGIFLEVLEQHFFLLPEPWPEPELPETAPEAYLEVGMRVTGDLVGEFVFLIPRSVAKEANENLTAGEEPENLEAAQEDVAMEILNIIGPNILIRWIERRGLAGQESFEVSLPGCVGLSEQTWNLARDAVRGAGQDSEQKKRLWTVLAANGLPLLLSVEIHKECER